MARNLILYYSRKGENYWGGSIRQLEKGNTEIAAELLREAVGGDLFELETVEPYSADYKECCAQAKQEKDADARPALKRYVDSLDAYDNVFVCGPCWCGTFPCAVFSQLERLDFFGKKVMALMTHEGSGLGRCEQDLRRLCRGAAFGQGLAVRGMEAANSGQAIADWANREIQ